jgi:GNAT superfamily N-acetyltransferase
MKLFKHMYRNEDDYWRLRSFLQKTLLLNHHFEINWQAARLDYWRYFGNPHIEFYALNEAICLWETEDGDIAGFIVPENRGNAHLQVHPDYCTEALGTEMLLAAEYHLAESDENGQSFLTVWAHQTDECRIQVLQEHGYQRGDWPEHQFRRSLEDPIEMVYPPSGYGIRPLGRYV